MYGCFFPTWPWYFAARCLVTQTPPTWGGGRLGFRMDFMIRSSSKPHKICLFPEHQRSRVFFCCCCSYLHFYFCDFLKQAFSSKTWTSDEYERAPSLQNSPLLMWLSNTGLLWVVMVMVQARTFSQARAMKFLKTVLINFSSPPTSLSLQLFSLLFHPWFMAGCCHLNRCAFWNSSFLC